MGLPDNVNERRFSRIESAIKQQPSLLYGSSWCQSGPLPTSQVKKKAHLRPAHCRGHLAATWGQIVNAQLDKFVIMGELALDGQLRPIKGACPLPSRPERKICGPHLPKQNARRPPSSTICPVYGVSNLRQVDFLNSPALHPEIHNTKRLFEEKNKKISTPSTLAMSRTGKHQTRHGNRPLQVGTMSFSSALPARVKQCSPKAAYHFTPLNINEAPETIKNPFGGGRWDFNTSLVTSRPFRSPHHHQWCSW